MRADIPIQKIKLFIWDLDETLWNGTISEGEVEVIPEFISFIRTTTDAGIVHSICSKNDFNTAKNKLQQLGLWDYFVFPSINWEPKGNRLKELILDMNLRDENVCFIDDNIQNLKEAAFYCSKIITLLPQEVYSIIDYPFEKKDINHKRLQQYRVLENKKITAKEFSSNDEFLISCNIKVTVSHDCTANIDRLHDLAMRSNQLNYTKNRCTKEELLETFNDPSVNSGYVTVTDNFGDYGIVGFYAVKDNKAIHYLFSCRTLGMLVEQYVYMLLGCPEIDIAGEVVTQLNNYYNPIWINQNQASSKPVIGKNKIDKSFLFKGPCDISQVFSFIKENKNMKSEFTYINSVGFSVEGHNHSAQIITSLSIDDKQKKQLLEFCPWLDENNFETELKDNNFDYLVLSMVTDAGLGVYRHKKTDKYIAFYPKKYNITIKENFDKFENDILKKLNIEYGNDLFEKFSDEFEYVLNDDFSLTIESLDKLYDYLIGKNTKIILLLGSEKKYPGKVSYTYEKRECDHKLLNSLLRKWAASKNNVILMPFDKYITGDKCFLDTINHFTKIVYYKMAEDLVGIVNDSEAASVCGKGLLYKKLFEQKIKSALSKVKK